MEDLTTKSLDEATKWLDNQKMSLTVTVKEEENLEKEEGTILRTEPAAGETLKTGDTVIIYVATGMKTELMPSLSGMTYEQAEKAMKELVEELGLTLEKVEEYDKNTEEGKVIRTSPAYNETVKSGDTVKIYVCVAETATVPDVVGKNVEVAKAMLDVYKFTKVTVVYKTGKEAADTVIEQSVAKDTQLALDAEIILTVSSGQKTKTVKYSLGDGSGNVDDPNGVTTYSIVITNTITKKQVYSGQVTASQVIELELTGYGIMTYEVTGSDGVLVDEFAIDFDS